MHQVFLSLGSNMGDRRKHLLKALRSLESKREKVVSVSGIYETEPWGVDYKDKFYNQVVEVLTDREPVELLDRLQQIEKEGGRKISDEPFAPRTIDLDILFYDNLIFTALELKIPHPLIHARKFVLIPLTEIAPEFRHPVLGKTISQLLGICDDEREVVKVI